LATAITTLPEGDWKASDSRSIAVRLVDRLPGHVLPPAQSPRGRRIGGQYPKSETQKWLIWTGLAVAVLIAGVSLLGD
jgi:hypothetical protein